MSVKMSIPAANLGTWPPPAPPSSTRPPPISPTSPSVSGSSLTTSSPARYPTSRDQRDKKSKQGAGLRSQRDIRDTP